MAWDASKPAGADKIKDSDDNIRANNAAIEAVLGNLTAGTPANVFKVTSAGKVGLNTATIPHGGIGNAMLALEGSNASADGPHVQFTTASDDYPLMQILIVQHDAIAIAFDAYNVIGGTWESSDADSNFAINKDSDLLKFLYDSGVAQGAEVTWNDGIVLATDGGIYFDSLLQQTAAGLVVEYWDATGEIYAETSTRRFKKYIRKLNVDTSKLLNFTPKSYTDKETGREEFGLIAEEVAEIMPEVVVFDKEDKPLGIKLTKLPIMNLNEIKKLDKRLLALEA